jgi:hypothetical protein
MLMDLREYAKKELALSGVDEDIYGDKVSKDVLALIELFISQGHSGASSALLSGLFYKLVNYSPLVPLTGEDDEWFEPANGLFQNKRCFHVFKNDERVWDSATNENITFPYLP